MHNQVEEIVIITKAGHDRAGKLGREMAAWLREREVAHCVVEHAREEECPLPESPLGLILVLGGDGTLLSVARAIGGSRVPVMGVNLGRLGFLSGVPADGWRDFLQQVLWKGVDSSERVVLAVSVLREGREIHFSRAVNDAVINRGTLARLIRLRLAVDGNSLGQLRADGLVASTPTGSTGYSVSAGGPVVHPELDVFSVTPICPFLQNAKPMVLPGGTVVEAVVEETDADVYLTVDGQAGFPLEPGDHVRLTRAEPGLLLVRYGTGDYYRKLSLD